MKSENEYIGDDKLQKLLEHYACPTPLEVVKLRFAGAICSPNGDLRPTDVISSLWENNNTPRLETKKEAELFFKFFMGLWDDIFHKITRNNITLPKISADDNLLKVCESRYEMIELGFVEGFWGGLEDIKVPAHVAEVVDSLSRLALLYKSLAGKITPGKENKNIFTAIIDCDKTVNKSIGYLIEHYALPHIEELTRTVH
ncbi:MAG: hypothetical protein J6Y91_03195 [Alphaproteobacteria bacterium]|nr:hypothetical protein [Alphaproteobacteria bacterium]